jgi:hypothetical protein
MRSGDGVVEGNGSPPDYTVARASSLIRSAIAAAEEIGIGGQPGDQLLRVAVEIDAIHPCMSPSAGRYSRSRLVDFSLLSTGTARTRVSYERHIRHRREVRRVVEI